MANENWHMSKSIPISLIFAILVQTVGVVWWASTLDSKVSQLDRTLANLVIDTEEEDLRQWARINDNEELVALAINNERVSTAIISRVEEDIKTMQQDLKEMNSLLQEFFREKLVK